MDVAVAGVLAADRLVYVPRRSSAGSHGTHPPTLVHACVIAGEPSPRIASLRAGVQGRRRCAASGGGAPVRVVATANLNTEICFIYRRPHRFCQLLCTCKNRFLTKFVHGACTILCVHCARAAPAAPFARPHTWPHSRRGPTLHAQGRSLDLSLPRVRAQKTQRSLCTLA